MRKRELDREQALTTLLLTSQLYVITEDERQPGFVSKVDAEFVLLAGMFKKLALMAALIAAFAVGVQGCGSGRGLGIEAAILAPSFKTAPQADLTGQSNVFTGTLGSGTTATFAAIEGVNYNVSVSSSPANENLVIDIFDNNGNELDAKYVTTNNGINYFHASPSEHVLVVLRPYDPLNTGVNITQFQITGIGTYSQTNLNVNIVVAGDDFTGFGAFNDLAALDDRANLATALLTTLNQLHSQNNTGITFTASSFSLTTAQVKSSQPNLVDAQGHTICTTQSEPVNGSGYANIDTSGLDEWASTSNLPGQSLTVFIIHHFATDGVIGLSPRPGSAFGGSGPGSALCVGAFLQENGQIAGARSVADMGVVLTHEIGHFLGLLHTTTFSPSPALNQVTDAIDDGVSDTPAAGSLQTLIANAQARGDSSIGIGDGCADENYIMFYQEKSSQNLFSPMQIKIIKATLSCLPH